MNKDLRLTSIFTELAEHLYNFLPASGAPITFATIARDMGFFDKYWNAGSKLSAINTLLEGVYYGESPEHFANLIVRVVQGSIRYRKVKDNPLLKEEVQALNKTLHSLGVEIPDLKNLKFLRNLPSRPQNTSQRGNAYSQFLGLLHPALTNHIGKLFENGHYSQAIFEGCKFLEKYTQERAGKEYLSGRDLMAKVLSENNPIIKLNKMLTPSDKDEQEGFKLIMMGIMVGIRNPKAHTIVNLDDPKRALKYLYLISLCLERIDEGEK